MQQALSKLSKETERQNRLERRQWDLEAENRSLRKQLAQKEENGLLQKADLSADAAIEYPVRAQIRIQAHHQLQAFPSCCTESAEPEFSGS